MQVFGAGENKIIMDRWQKTAVENDKYNDRPASVRIVMDESRIFGRTYEMMGKALDVSAKRHNLITGNIANMDTIGYKPKDLEFKNTLNRLMTDRAPDSMSRTNEKHFSGVGEKQNALTGRNSEDVDIYHLDSVNIDREMTNLVENNIKYRTTTELVIRKLDKLKYAIREGGK